MFSEIDECADRLSKCSQQCINTDGAYQCGCNDGFIIDSDGFTCSSNFSSIGCKVLYLYSLPYSVGKSSVHFPMKAIASYNKLFLL